MGLLNLTAVLFLIFRNICTPIGAVHFILLPIVYKDSCFYISSPTLVLSLSFLIIAILTGIRWHLIVALIYILWIMALSNFYMHVGSLYAFGEMSVQVLCSFFKRIVSIFAIELVLDMFIALIVVMIPGLHIPKLIKSYTLSIYNSLYKNYA